MLGSTSYICCQNSFHEYNLDFKNPEPTKKAIGWHYDKLTSIVLCGDVVILPDIQLLYIENRIPGYGIIIRKFLFTYNLLRDKRQLYIHIDTTGIHYVYCLTLNLFICQRKIKIMLKK